MIKGAQILDRFQKNFGFVFFPLGLSNFWVGAWFPFDEGQFKLYIDDVFPSIFELL